MSQLHPSPCTAHIQPTTSSLATVEELYSR
jgi:hypothetical protein